jgi:hypothetical protein
MKQEAWGDDLGLTPRGKDEYDSTYTDLFSHHYTYNVTNVEMHWQVRVEHNNVDRAEPQYVWFPKEAVNGSFIGTCTCGADKTNAVLCEHMAAIAISSCLRPQITPISIMPT